MEWSPILIFNAVIAVFFAIAFFYQLIYVVIVFIFKHAPEFPAQKQHRYGFVVCAHNEGIVITELIKSMKNQDYPEELLDVFVFCDNCTDDTAQLAREAGAIVYERPGGGQVGKSWVMDYGLRCVMRDYPNKHEAFIVFDADNILEPTYVTYMNEVFDTGNFAAITSYRNSKNFDSSWVSRGYGTWFLREATYLNNARMILKTSCAISGTGYLISADIIKKMGGWDFHLLTEDIQFSTFCAHKGYRIGFARKAMFYDEQPVTFSASWNQRMRWTKGFYQVFVKYASSLLNGMNNNKENSELPNEYHQPRRLFIKNFAAYDMFMTIAPAMILTLLSITVNGIYLLAGLFVPNLVSMSEVYMCLSSFAMIFGGFYFTFFLLALLVTITERRNIHATAWHKFTNLFTFPIFMLSYIPIALVAAVKRVDWVPTKHTISASLDDIDAK